MTNLGKSLIDLRHAEETVRATMCRAYPVGGVVSWERGGHIHGGTVVRHSPYYPELWALNGRTGREVKVSASSIYRAEKEGAGA